MKTTQLVLIIFLMTSCIRKHDNLREPDLSLAIGYKAKKEDVHYQYYERFGFTDVCIHSRSYFRVKQLPKGSNWKKLPISKMDFDRINKMQNKSDVINGTFLNVVYKDKDLYSDISLEKWEFAIDSACNYKVSLLIGYYRITTTTFEVFDSQNNMIYYEFHSCK